jgi:hypothetical protein
MKEDLAARTYNEQVELGLPHTPMNWHVWKRAFRAALVKVEGNEYECSLPNKHNQYRLSDGFAYCPDCGVEL